MFVVKFKRWLVVVVVLYCWIRWFAFFVVSCGICVLLCLAWSIPWWSMWFSCVWLFFIVFRSVLLFDRCCMKL